ncbi:MAG: CsgG/HfaB family protein [Holophagales bacterium]|jgi:curli biogenesis system outer membrane secretion channel CsgG|nr:CsgG/HfaB family protein [Holophagales bacterium]
MFNFQRRSAINATGSKAKTRLRFFFAVAMLATLLAPAPALSGAENASAIAAAPHSQESGKIRMGVPTFANSSTTRDGSYGERFADMLVSELMQNRNYELIERTRLNKVIEEQGLGMSGVLDQSNVAQIGKVAGLDYIVLGNILETSAVNKSGTDILTKGTIYYSEIKVVVNLKVIEVETGKIAFSDNAQDNATIHFGGRPGQVSPENYFGVAQKAIAKAAFKIMREIAPLEASVLKVNKVKDKIVSVVIDLGREDGLREEQHYEIVREGESILNREGKVVGVEMIVIAHVNIERVEANTATAKVVKIEKDPATKKEYEIVRGDLAKMQDHSKGRTAGEKFSNWLKK